MTPYPPASRTRATASLRSGGIPPVILLISQSSATAVRATSLTQSRWKWRPSASSVDRAGMKLGPSLGPLRRQVVCSGSPRDPPVCWCQPAPGTVALAGVESNGPASSDQEATSSDKEDSALEGAPLFR